MNAALSLLMSTVCVTGIYVAGRTFVAALVLEHRAGLARLERAGLR